MCCDALAGQELWVTAMSRIFRLTDTVKRDPVIDNWINERCDALGDIARHWFDVMRACGEDVREVLHDGHPTACVADVAFAYVNAFSEHVNVGFFHGTELADPARLLQGTGKYMRHVKLRPDSGVDAAALRNLIDAAYIDILRRIGDESCAARKPDWHNQGNLDAMSRAAVKSSFERCEKTGDFADTFYGVFLNTTEEVAAMFAETDFKKQRKLLRATVFMMVKQDVSEPQAAEALERIGRSHSKQKLDVRPELYEIWLDSLCATVKKLDPQWTEQLEADWREQMRPGITLITSLYE